MLHIHLQNAFEIYVYPGYSIPKLCFSLDRFEKNKYIELCVSPLHWWNPIELTHFIVIANFQKKVWKTTNIIGSFSWNFSNFTKIYGRFKNKPTKQKLAEYKFKKKKKATSKIGVNCVFETIFNKGKEEEFKSAL